LIPNIIHFIYGFKSDFGGKPFALVHYLAIKSAYEVNKPEKIFFYYKYMPSGEWWDKAKSYLTLIKTEPPKYIFWNKLYHFAHQADVMRLKILNKHGGIYLDLDTICVKPLNEFLQHTFVIGKQGGTTKGLCNAVMLSRPKSKFVRKWINSYISFRSKGFGNHWDEHSVIKPKQLAEKYKQDLTILEEKTFHFPTWEEDQLKLMFEDSLVFEFAYVHHLWESASWEKYLSKLTVKDILEKDTSFNLLARKFL
jgi:hypothetical protein